MQTEVVVAGFGGQGVLFTGQLLAYAAMDAGLEVTWIPSYGPEMRGGTANCTVIISNEEIGSPLVRNPSAVIAMNRPSLDKYEPIVKQGGLLIVNGSLVDRPVERTDVRSVVIPASEEAEALGDKRLTNMVLLGALLANSHVLEISDLEAAIKAHTSSRHQRLIPLNIQAVNQGARFIVSQLAG